jgi:hypothetical protein
MFILKRLKYHFDPYPGTPPPPHDDVLESLCVTQCAGIVLGWMHALPWHRSMPLF